MASPAQRWWKDATIYQIWPASYKDSNGDGFGDIPGIISTLDYLTDLGTNCIWLSPMYDSPQHDMGYDISDYEGIWAKFGTMEDMERLIREVRARGMELVLDLVINHTSNEHKWFQESMQSKDNECCDWYIWKDPKYVDGERKPPNNWKSFFGGSAWEYVPQRDQYYLHLFLPQQPDLNWENPVTRKAIYKSAIEFWLTKGVAGFRVDIVGFYSKNVSFQDAPITDPANEYQVPRDLVTNGPRMHEFLQEQRREALEKHGDVVMIGEFAFLTKEETWKYVAADYRELDMLFDFEMVFVGTGGFSGYQNTFRYKLPDLKIAIGKVQDILENPKAWVTVYAENHDLGRSISRFATDDPEYRERGGKLLAIMLSTLSGTLFLYQGQEIGMSNIPKEWIPEECKDISAINYWNETKETCKGNDEVMEDLRTGLQLAGRDNARTPVQWSGDEHAGFSTAKPWMRVNENYKKVNIASQQKEPSSLLAFWKKALKARKEHRDIFIYGRFQMFDVENANTFTYVKEYEGKRALVALNFSEEAQPLYVPAALRDKSLTLVMANVDHLQENLVAWEARVYVIEETVGWQKS